MLTTLAQAAAAESAPVLWYANRGSGFVLLALLTLTTTSGVLAGAVPGTRGWPRAAGQAMHRNIGLLSVVFLAIHVVTAAIDEFVDIRWWHTLVPFTGEYQQPWLGLGVVGLNLIVAVIVTSLARHRMIHRWWRGVHMFTYVAWALGIVHGLGMGTDAGARWGLSFSVICALVVAGAAGARLVSAGAQPPTAAASTEDPVLVDRRIPS